MKYTINQLYECLTSRGNEVCEVFKNHFGEEYVDVQPSYIEQGIKNKINRFLKNSYNMEYPENDEEAGIDFTTGCLKSLQAHLESEFITIYVWWPRVTITNENGRSVGIQDLYAKVIIYPDGRIPYEQPGFTLNRATYSEEQFLSNFLHSHVSGIPKHNFSTFMQPCLGRGPIRETINTLKNDSNEVTWMLFCQELDIYVTVESLSGGPYKRMETIGKKNALSSHEGYTFNSIYNEPGKFYAFFTRKELSQFIEYYLKNGHLSISFRNGKYTSGLSYYDYMIDVSNSFIDFFNNVLSKKHPILISEKFFEYHLLYRVVVENEKFYSHSYPSDDTYGDISNYQDKFVLKFKGKNITTKIYVGERSEVTLATILNQYVAMYILERIIKIINFRYKNEYNKTRGTSKEAALPDQGVYYI